jgi:AraC-like DNA-binding protein
MQQFLRFSTDNLPERDRVAIWSEVFGRYIIATKLEAVAGIPFSQNATLRSLPGLSLASMSCSGFRGSRTGDMLADGNDNLNIIINIAGTGEYRQLGREAVVSSHEAVLLSSTEDVYALYPGALRSLMISAPRQAVAAMAGNAEAALCRTLPPSEALRLLLSYVQSTDRLSLETPGVGQAFATHLQDLMALVIGATRDGEELARGRGLRAARLAAIKVDIGRSLGTSDLSIGALALRHGVTPRYIQKLFESDGTTFTEHVIEQRLLEARRLLSDPEFADHSIGDIALRAGFGDLPYFTRSFRRRFGMTPSDAREQARRDSQDADDTDS